MRKKFYKWELFILFIHLLLINLLTHISFWIFLSILCCNFISNKSLHSSKLCSIIFFTSFNFLFSNRRFKILNKVLKPRSYILLSHIRIRPSVHSVIIIIYYTFIFVQYLFNNTHKEATLVVIMWVKSHTVFQTQRIYMQ